MDIQSKIVGKENVAPLSLKAHPHNFRLHPMQQRKAVSASLDELGFVGDIIASQRTRHVLNGHLRVELAIGESRETVPVTWLDVTEQEELVILAFFDRLNEQAKTDGEKLRSLLGGLESDLDPLQNMMDEWVAQYEAKPERRAPVKAVVLQSATPTPPPSVQLTSAAPVPPPPAPAAPAQASPVEVVEQQIQQTAAQVADAHAQAIAEIMGDAAQAALAPAAPAAVASAAPEAAPAAPEEVQPPQALQAVPAPPAAAPAAPVVTPDAPPAVVEQTVELVPTDAFEAAVWEDNPPVIVEARKPEVVVGTTGKAGKAPKAPTVQIKVGEYDQQVDEATFNAWYAAMVASTDGTYEGIVRELRKRLEFPAV